MVPPEVTASRWAPGRAVSTPVSPLPDQPRPELGEVLGRIAAAEHVEHRVVRAAGQVAEAAGPPDQGIQLVDLGLLHGDHGDDLLGEHVQRVA